MKRIYIDFCICFFVLAVMFPNLSRATILGTIDTEFDTLSSVNFGIVSVTENAGKLDFQVKLNLRSGQLGHDADLEYFYLNLLPGFTNVTATGQDVLDYDFEYSSVNGGPKKGFKAGNDGYFDFRVYFGSGGSKLAQTTFTVGADQALTEASINSLSEGGSIGPYYFALHAQSTIWSSAESEWAGATTIGSAPPGYGVPEPGTSLLLLFSIMGMICIHRKTKLSL